jgi:hypothetical protein
MVTWRSTLAPSRCSAILRWREQMAVCTVCWRGLAALMSWSSTTGRWLHCPSPSAATSGRSAKNASSALKHPYVANCRFHADTSRSAIPHWLTASSTGWSTMRIGSRCGGDSMRKSRSKANRENAFLAGRVCQFKHGDPSGAYPKHKFPQRRLWSTSRVIFDSRRKPEYPYTPRTRFSSRVAVAARGTHAENGDARAVFRSTRASVRQLIEPTPTQDHWHALFRPRGSGFCLLRR